MTIHYRPATDADVAHLRDLDLKCHEQPPADNRWWKYIAKSPHSGCMTACRSHVPIGMCVWEKQVFKLPDFKLKETTLHIYKTCVRFEFRKQGIGRKLIAYAHEEAVRLQCQYMSISIPEYRCGSEHPNDVDKWLNKLGFKATIILPGKINMYGREYDQFLFVFKVKTNE